MNQDEKLKAYTKKLKTLKPYLENALLTHKRCCGTIEEHYFTGFDGLWLCGKATKETKKFGGFAEVNDISVNNITHINRCSVEDFLNA